LHWLSDYKRVSWYFCLSHQMFAANFKRKPWTFFTYFSHATFRIYLSFYFSFVQGQKIYVGLEEATVLYLHYIKYVPKARIAEPEP
jgi:hypothetical protein